MFSQAGNKFPYSIASQVGDEWPQFSMVHVTLTSFASIPSRLIKAVKSVLPGALAQKHRNCSREGKLCYENLTPENSTPPASPQTSFHAYLNITSSIMLGKQKSFIHRMKVSPLQQEADAALPSLQHFLRIKEKL